MRTILRYYAIILLSLLTCFKVHGQSREAYIKQYSPIAIEQMKLTGIPASITMAQACHESAFGTSLLAVKANNHFGIKCHEWTGKKFHKDDDTHNECFRNYTSARESFEDHSDFIRYRDRYAFLFDLPPTDYKAWAYGLKKAGYATDSEYPSKIIDIIEKYHLYNLDTSIDPDDIPPTPISAEQTVKAVISPGSSLYNISLERNILCQNGVNFIVADGYETYDMLARQYNLFKSELLRYNDLDKDRNIEPGTIIYLQHKKKQAAKNLNKHVFEEGETMYGLSQRYAVKLSYLYKYNNLKNGEEPIPGTVILLRKK